MGGLEMGGAKMETGGGRMGVRLGLDGMGVTWGIESEGWGK